MIPEMPKQKPRAPEGFITVYEAAHLTGKSISMLCRAARQRRFTALKGTAQTDPWFFEKTSFQRAYPTEVFGPKRTKWNYVRPDMPVIQLGESNPQADAENAAWDEQLRKTREAIDASG